MIGYRIKGYTSIYTNYERFIHVLKTRHKDKNVVIEVLDMAIIDSVDKNYFLTMDRNNYDFE